MIDAVADLIVVLFLLGAAVLAIGFVLTALPRVSAWLEKKLLS